MALASSLRIGSSARSAGLAIMAFNSSSSLVLSPPLRMYWATKSVARRVASPRGIPIRMKSLVFIANLPTVYCSSTLPTYFNCQPLAMTVHFEKGGARISSAPPDATIL